MEIIKSKGTEILDIESEKDFKERNRKLAIESRKIFDKAEILTVDVMAQPVRERPFP